MAEKNWGHCKNCKHFGSHARQPDAAEAARCNQPQLTKFELRVFGASGCNAFELRAGLGEEAEAHP
jgi:hypothetical protein